MAQSLWIEVELGSEEMGQRISRAITSCYLVEVWGMRWLKERWLEKMEVMQNHELYTKLAGLLRTNNYGGDVQKYTLQRALYRSVEKFTQSLQIARNQQLAERGDTEVFVIELPKDVPKDAYVEMDIQRRKIWRKRIEEEGKITTVYGDLYLQGEWREVLQKCASDLDVPLYLLPFLWEGITIREPVREGEKWQIRFNFDKEMLQNAKEEGQNGKNLDSSRTLG